MDKKKQMAFNLNNFLLATSTAFDFKEKDLIGISLGHAKRVAYISLNLGIKYDLEPKQMADLCAYALCYNIGAESIEKIPFLNGKETITNPLFLEIILFASTLDKKFSLGINNIEKRFEAIDFIKKNHLDFYLDIFNQASFWLDLQNENDILMFIYSNLHDFTMVLDFEEILEISMIFHKIVNPDSDLINFSKKILEIYSFEHKDKYTFLIAISLQNIGKLVIPSNISNKNDKLTIFEYEEIKAYTYFTKKILNSIMGFSDISHLATKAQEKLDGSGYPLGLVAKDLSLKDRLIITLNIYNALREKKIYRNAHSHSEAIKIMKGESIIGKLDMSLVEEFDRIFS